MVKDLPGQEPQTVISSVCGRGLRMTESWPLPTRSGCPPVANAIGLMSMHPCNRDCRSRLDLSHRASPPQPRDAVSISPRRSTPRASPPQRPQPPCWTRSQPNRGVHGRPFDEARLLNLAHALRAQHPLERSPSGVVCTPAMFVAAGQKAQKINGASTESAPRHWSRRSNTTR